jgi:hypothetical protein
LWSYAEESAKLIFGAETDDPLFKLILARLTAAGEQGMSRTDLHAAFNRNVPAAQLLAGLAMLRDRGEARAERQKTGKPGAPTERWYAVRRNAGNERTKQSPGRPPGNSFVNSFNSFVRKPSAGESEVIV